MHTCGDNNLVKEMTLNVLEGHQWIGKDPFGSGLHSLDDLLWSAAASESCSESQSEVTLSTNWQTDALQDFLTVFSDLLNINLSVLTV